MMELNLIPRVLVKIMNIEQDFIIGPVVQQEIKKEIENQDNINECVDDFYMYLKK